MLDCVGRTWSSCTFGGSLLKTTVPVVDLLLHFGFVGRHLRLVGMRSSNAESWQMTSRPFLANLSNGPSCRSSLLQAAVVAGVLCWVVAFASKAAFELGALLSESHCLARLHEPV